MKINLIDTIILALMVAVLMIGGHQTYTIAKVEGFKIGFLKSYWIFMLLFILMALYQVRKVRREKQEKESINQSVKDRKSKSAKPKKQNKNNT